MTTPAVTMGPHPPMRQDQSRERISVSHSVHLRELEMPDGRKILVDRHAIAFVCEGKPKDFGGKRVTIVGFKTQARPCPVTAGYYDIKAWWRGDGANGSKAVRLRGDVETVLGAER